MESAPEPSPLPAAPVRPAKEPWLAATLSFLLPGLGQFYGGRVAAGVFFLAGTVGLGVVMILAIPFTIFGLLAAAALGCGLLALWIVSMVHAHHAARKANTPEAEQARRSAKDPWVAVFLSQIIAGVGHLYLGRVVSGILLLLVTLALMVVGPRGISLWLSVVPPLYTALVCVLAWRAAPAERRGNPKSIAGVAALTVAVSMASLGIALGLRATCVEAFAIGSGGMSPTLAVGDRVLASKTGLRNLRRGDIIVFRNPLIPHPEGGVRTYASRVVAFAGEQVECRDGGVFVNGKRFEEGVFARLHYVEHPSQRYARGGEPFKVGEDAVFVLGDNSASSFDSRFFGDVPRANIAGRVTKRWWPLDRFGPVE